MKVKVVYGFTPVNEDIRHNVNVPCSSNIPRMYMIDDTERSFQALKARVNLANQAMESYSSVQKRLQTRSAPMSFFQRLRHSFS